jgi:hypothetical protein
VRKTRGKAREEFITVENFSYSCADTAKIEMRNEKKGERVKLKIIYLVEVALKIK